MRSVEMGRSPASEQRQRDRTNDIQNFSHNGQPVRTVLSINPTAIEPAPTVQTAAGAALGRARRRGHYASRVAGYQMYLHRRGTSTAQ